MKTNSWIDDLVNENVHVETPEPWLWWSFLCCIAAVAGNNYYVRSLKGDLLYYPNLYVMLLGESGLGKGYPINKAKLLVMRSEATRVIAGRSSIQGIVAELATTKSREGQALITDSRGFIVNGELSTAIIQDPDSLTILTDLYDGFYNPEWDNMLKMGKEKLKNPCITALFGSSPAHFYDSIPQANIEGGYIGRNLIIFEEKRSKDVDLLDDISMEPKDHDDKFESYVVPRFVPHLKGIAAKKGELRPTESARQLFNTWRRDWRSKQPVDKTGFLNRVPDHVIKVAMCLSLSHYDFKGFIEDEDFREAIERVTHLTYANRKATEGRGGAEPLALPTKVVLDLLVTASESKLTRKRLLTKGYGHFSSYVLDQVIDNLLEMGWVKRSRIGVGKNMDWEVSLAGEPLESLEKYRKGSEKMTQ